MVQNSEKLLDTMVRKGWNKEEIEKTMQILYGDENEDKRISVKERMNMTLYWMVIFCLCVSNLAIAVLLVPVMFLIYGWPLYLIIAIIGLIFGIVFDFFVKDIENVEKKHHIFAVILIPFLCIFNIVIISLIAERLSGLLDLIVTANFFLVSIVYVVFFVSPYAISLFRGKV